VIVDIKRIEVYFQIKNC